MILGSSPEPGQFGGFELPFLVAFIGGILLAAYLLYIGMRFDLIPTFGG